MNKIILGILFTLVCFAIYFSHKETQKVEKQQKYLSSQVELLEMIHYSEILKNSIYAADKLKLKLPFSYGLKDVLITLEKSQIIKMYTKK